ncbi:MAG TPA: Asp-tRNA(Asn)/Glu-tRNA(Gln) amidotransferase subunit GatC [Acidobacteriota bacterium]|nr:Asp-tRNA(Asn)/Glu-tRNA(Gln) amidotransferase subunit GatC [Acidobacteriota bacterium]
MSDEGQDTNVVERIAELARLEFGEDELVEFAAGFRRILEYFRQLREVETDDVAPTYHALLGSEAGTPLRDDEVQESLPSEEVVRAAPESHDGRFRVPRVIE